MPVFNNHSIFLMKKQIICLLISQLKTQKILTNYRMNHSCKSEWAYMKDIMETNEDGSPVVIELKEVFYLK